MATMARQETATYATELHGGIQGGRRAAGARRGKTVGAAARDLDLTESSLRNWVERARADRGKGKPGVLTTAEREELSRLRKENRELRIERDILKKAAAFFAKENS